MPEEEEFDIRAEVLPDDLKSRVRKNLKEALRAQLQKEAETLGGIGGPGDELAIHGKTGVSTRERY